MEWKDLSIKQYQDICKEIEEDYPDDLERSIGILSTLTGKSISYYTDTMPISELRTKLKGLEFIKTKPPLKTLYSKIKIGTKRYRFNLDMRSISAGQYIDLTELVKDSNKINDNIHTILATLCEEVNFFGRKKKTSTEQRAEYLLDHMKMDYVFSLSSFFLTSYQRLITATRNFLESETAKMRKQTQKAVDLALSSIGDGIIL